MKKESKISVLVSYLSLILISLTIVLPLLWGVSMAFRSNQEIITMQEFSISTFIPKKVTLEGFYRMFSKLNFVTVFKNTLIVAIIVTFGSMILNTMAGYAFARINFIGKKPLFLLVVATLIMPIEVLIVPLYMQVVNMKLVNTYYSLIIPFLASGFGIFFMRQFILGLPIELDESAYLDGCGRFRTFYHILLPLSKTPLITLGLIAFLAQWDSFVVPVTFVTGREKMLLQVALSYLSFDELINDVSLVFAGLIVASIPVVILFVCLQKYYVVGIATSGLKG